MSVALGAASALLLKATRRESSRFRSVEELMPRALMEARNADLPAVLISARIDFGVLPCSLEMRWESSPPRKKPARSVSSTIKGEPSVGSNEEIDDKILLAVRSCCACDAGRLLCVMSFESRIFRSFDDVMPAALMDARKDDFPEVTMIMCMETGVWPCSLPAR